MTEEAFPSRLVPMLATPATDVPSGEGWAFELKWDGVRAVAYLHHGRLRLESRNLNDVTPRYPELAGLAGQFASHAVVLDGEVVAFDDGGRPSFGRLQGRMHLTGERAVAARAAEIPVVYVAFDLLHLDGRSTRGLAWSERRRLLEDLQVDGPTWRTPRAHLDDGDSLLEASRAGGLEGVLAKRCSSPYTPGRRTKDWLKVKNARRQEFVIGGWLPGGGSRSGRIGALVVGCHDESGLLRHAGKVGTGFTDAELARLAARLLPLARETSPFADRVPWREARFVEPALVADVEFTEWTATGMLRHPSYKGLRDDKDPAEVRREPEPR